jgi:tetratricopeptide (TPR) repeat protein
MSAESYKEKGNEYFKKGDYEKAIENYTYACEIDPKNHLYYTNRSLCYASMKRWDKSLRDADKSIALNPNWVKVGTSTSTGRSGSRSAYHRLYQHSMRLCTASYCCIYESLMSN